MINLVTAIKYISLVVFLVAINVSDLKSYKIKNKAIFPALIVALILAISTRTFLDSVYGMLIPLVLFPFYALKMLGAGDVKAMCVIGAFVGFKLSVINIALTFIAGGIIAIGFMLINGNFVKRMKYLFNYFNINIYYIKYN